MKKKYFSMALLVFVVCIGFLFFTSNVFYALAEEIKIMQYCENSAKSLAVYSDAILSYKSIKTSSDGEAVFSFSDDYAGAYIDERGILNVGYVGPRKAVSNFNGRVIYNNRNFSYNYLKEVQSKVTDIMLDYDIYMTGLDEEQNYVSVYLSNDSCIQQILRYLQNECEINEEALNFIVDNNGRAIKNSIAYGGESISRRIDATTISRGTICVNALDNTTGRLGVLTNEHVARASQSPSPTMSYRGHLNLDSGTFSENAIIGNGTKGQHFGTVDAAFVPFSNQQNWTVTPYGKYSTTPYTNVRLGNNDQIIQGQTVKKIGQTTGVTDGKITYASSTIVLNYGTEEEPDKQTITDVFRYSNQSLGGDSGGPVYLNDGNDLYLIGMNFAGPADSSNVYGIGCRIQNVMEALDVTPITNDSFNTTVVGEAIEINQMGFNPTGAFVVPAEVKGKTIVNIGANAFANQSKLTSIALPSTITEIGTNAFTGCTSLTDITIPENVTSIGMGAFANCSSLNNIAIPAKAAYIGEGVFAGCSNLNISVSTSNTNYSSQGNILYNKAKTKIIGSGAVVTNITIPKTVTEIGVSAFSDNTNIQNLEIYGTPKIADLAFNNCANLRKIYFYSYIIPEIGSGAFANNEFVLYVPHSKQSEYMADFSGYTSDIASIPIQVTFKVDGKVYKTLNTYFGANITGVDVPFKEGYTFNYWIDSDGNTYENGGLWDSTSSFTVEADWTARQSYINFVGYGTEGIAPILATYDLPIGTLPTPNVSGPVFIGWKDENGVYYTADTIWKQTNNLTLLADYEGEESGNSILYYVDLDQDGGEGGADNVKAEYMAPMPAATAPTRVGYIFKGYYTGKNGTGVKYYNADMSSAKNWDIASDRTLYAYWEGLKFTVNFAKNGGTGGTSSVQVTYGSVMPTSGLVAPTKLGYTFDGYYDENNKQYYIGPNMNSDVKWDKLTSVTLYAKWIKTEYTITLVLYDNMTNAIKLYYGDKVDLDYAPYRAHYEFKGYYEKPNGQGKCYVKGVLKQTFNNYYHIEPESTGQTWNQYSDGVLYAHWELLKANYSITVVSIGNGYLDSRSISITSGQSITLAANTPSGYTFDSWSINGVTYRTENVTYTFELHRSYITGEITIHTSNYSGSAAYSDGSVTLYFQKNADSGDDNCVAAGTLITLADGRQVPIESLRGDEMLLVWNLYTGRFDVAPILFIEHDALATYKIINLMFSDGTTVKVIYEHAFWDFNLNKYVFLRADAAQYVGHWFNKQTMDANGNMVWTKVQLMNVTITEEYTTAWSLVTYGHLCVYVNGMLSMPGATEGLINIFEVDSNTMQINQEKYLADIAKYGLFTYEEFVQIYSVPQTIFEAFGGEYLKVAIGKGLIGYNTLGKLIERYSEFFA